MCEVRRAVAEALWGMCAADAMSMPVHWYYNTRDIRRDFSGWIRGLRAPRDTHPSSILSLSSTGQSAETLLHWPILTAPDLIWPVCDSCAAGSGRSGSSAAAAPVVGNVILHDKLRFWTDPRRSVHYHQGNVHAWQTQWIEMLRWQLTGINNFKLKYYSY